MGKSVPTFDKICQIATSIFAIQGYDAASLNTISEHVGIRKASLYSHFSSKNELFHKVFVDACAIETEFMESCYKGSVEFNDIYESYCKLLPSRFKESAYLQLFLKVSFISPKFLEKEIKKSYENYLEGIRAHFCASLKKQNYMLNDVEIRTFSEAYLGIIDSLHIELIYASVESYEKKCAAMLEVLAKAIKSYDIK